MISSSALSKDDGEKLLSKKFLGGHFGLHHPGTKLPGSLKIASEGVRVIAPQQVTPLGELFQNPMLGEIVIITLEDQVGSVRKVATKSVGFPYSSIRRMASATSLTDLRLSIESFCILR
jgi:hypothetical protein